jgi:hypothetical protein
MTILKTCMTLWIAKQYQYGCFWLTPAPKTSAHMPDQPRCSQHLRFHESDCIGAAQEEDKVLHMMAVFALIKG